MISAPSQTTQPRVPELGKGSLITCGYKNQWELGREKKLTGISGESTERTLHGPRMYANPLTLGFSTIAAARMAPVAHRKWRK